MVPALLIILLIISTWATYATASFLSERDDRRMAQANLRLTETALFACRHRVAILEDYIAKVGKALSNADLQIASAQKEVSDEQAA